MTSGSDKRRRGVTLSARFSEEEAAAARESADRAGMTVASLIRVCVLDDDRKPRPTRRAPVSTTLLSRILRALGPVADSLRQIAEQPQIGREDPALKEALSQLGDISLLCLQLMGRGRMRPPAPIPWDRESLRAIFARAGRAHTAVCRPHLPFPGGPGP